MARELGRRGIGCGRNRLHHPGNAPHCGGDAKAEGKSVKQYDADTLAHLIHLHNTMRLIGQHHQPCPFRKIAGLPCALCMGVEAVGEGEHHASVNLWKPAHQARDCLLALT